MADTYIAVAQEVDRYAPERMAATAAAKAKRLWPDVIGEVLADEIMALLDLPPWLRSQTRTQRLINVILGIAEGAGDPAMTDRLVECRRALGPSGGPGARDQLLTGSNSGPDRCDK